MKIVLKNLSQDLTTVSREYHQELIDDYVEEYPKLNSQILDLVKKKGIKFIPLKKLWALPD